MPLTKLPGIGSIACLLAKNQATAVTVKHLGLMNLEFAQGRSVICKYLELFQGSVDATVQGLADSDEYCRNSDVDQTFQQSADSDCDFRTDEYRVPSNIARRDVEFKGADRRDGWSCSRDHRKSSRRCFAPIRFASCRKFDMLFVNMRQAKGANARATQSFNIVDRWAQLVNARGVLDLPWAVSTTFHLVQDSVFKAQEGCRPIKPSTGQSSGSR